MKIDIDNNLSINPKSLRGVEIKLSIFLPKYKFVFFSEGVYAFVIWELHAMRS